MANNSLIIHVPHASTIISEEYYSDILLSNHELNEEIAWSTDLYCDEIFNIGSGVMVTADFSRLVCDVERFRDDDMEFCSKSGNGVFYTNTLRGRPLRTTNERIKEKALDLYDKHHERFTRVVGDALEEYNKCLIIDAHSFCNDLIVGRDLPDICIGVDEFHTPSLLTKSAQSFLDNKGYKAAINYPYSGAIVPFNYYKKDKRVLSIMIEINKRLYLDSALSSKLDMFSKIKSDIAELVETLFSEFIRLNNSFGCQQTNEIKLVVNDFQAFELCAALKYYRREMESFHAKSDHKTNSKGNTIDSGALSNQCIISEKIVKHLDVIIKQIYKQWPDFK